jgi:ATP-dependent Clp protease ATP-binding subunit ClpB
MTSNLGQQEIAESAELLRQVSVMEGGAESFSRSFMNKVLYPILRSHFKKDEFLGRINDMLVFIPFSDDELYQITRKELQRWAQKVPMIHAALLFLTDRKLGVGTSRYQVVLD